MKVVKKVLNTEDFNEKVKVYFNKKIKEIRNGRKKRFFWL